MYNITRWVKIIWWIKINDSTSGFFQTDQHLQDFFYNYDKYHIKRQSLTCCVRVWVCVRGCVLWAGVMSTPMDTRLGGLQSQRLWKVFSILSGTITGFLRNFFISLEEEEEEEREREGRERERERERENRIRRELWDVALSFEWINKIYSSWMNYNCISFIWFVLKDFIELKKFIIHKKPFF